MMNPTHETLHIIEFSDPVCSWCWGSEPVLRRLETLYGERVKISFVMGGLVEDIRTFHDPYNGIGGDPVASNKHIAAHWLEGAARHQMPVQAEGFSLFSVEFPSTFPLNIAYKAAQLTDPARAERFLRRLREATAAEARLTSRPEVLVELASEVGLDLAEFLRHMKDGTAERAFEADRALCKHYGVRGFPSFLLKYGQKEMLLRSFQTAASFDALIDTFTQGALTPIQPPATEAEILGFIHRYTRVAPVELQTTFQLTPDDLSTMLGRLSTEGRIRVLPAGNGHFIDLAPHVGQCDSASGTCAL